MVTYRPSARVITVIFAIAIVLLLVPFAGRLIVDPQERIKEPLILGGPNQDGGIRTSLNCIYLNDVSKPGLYSCDGVIVDSRIDATGENIQVTLERIARADPRAVGAEPEQFSQETKGYRYEFTLPTQQPYIVLSYPLVGDFEGMSMYVTIDGLNARAVEEKMRTSLAKEVNIRET